MITIDEIRTMLVDVENDRVERTISTTNTDKFGQAICAFANDLPNHNLPGYLFLGVTDDGEISGINVTDELLKNIAAIRTDGNIQPQPSMVVQKVPMPEGDIIMVEVQPHVFPPVRYKGRVWIRVGPRKGIASEADERILMEKRRTNVSSFDSMPCLNATLDDLDTRLFKYNFLPKAVDDDVIKEDTRDIRYQMSSFGFYDTRYDCPTNAGMLFFAKNLRRFIGGAYVQYVRFAGKDRASDILSEHEFKDNLCTILPEIDTFIKTTITNRRPIPVSSAREENVVDYPDWATRELVMNAICHRDYESNGPIQFYQYADRIEIENHGGLYGRANEQNFPNVNDYRNLIVAEGMKVLGFVNRQSRGVLKVQRELRENENGEAIYDFGYQTAVLVCEMKSTRGERLKEEAVKNGWMTENELKTPIDGGKLTSRLPKMGENELKTPTDGGKLTSETDIDGGKLTSKPAFPTLLIKNVYELLKMNRKIKYSQMEDNLGVDENTIWRAVAWLKENGYINPERSKVKGEWQLL